MCVCVDAFTNDSQLLQRCANLQSSTCRSLVIGVVVAQEVTSSDAKETVNPTANGVDVRSSSLSFSSAGLNQEVHHGCFGARSFSWMKSEARSR